MITLGSTNLQDTIVTALTDEAGDKALEANHIYTLANPAGDINFTLPTVGLKASNPFNQILVQLAMDTIVNINTGTTYNFYNEAPDLSKAGIYNIIYEYDYNTLQWYVGVIYKGIYSGASH